MHGSSTAAWTAVIVSLAGFLIGGIALIPTPNWPLFIVGVVLAVGAAPLGKILAAAGLGIDRSQQHH